MPELFNIARQPMRPVVAGHNQKCVVRETLLVKRRHDPTDGRVNMYHEISVIPRLALAVKLFRRHPRRMRRTQREVDKELFGTRLLTDGFNRLVRNRRQHVLMLKARCDAAWAPKPATRGAGTRTRRIGQGKSRRIPASRR